MGVLSIYTGLIYNDVFSKSLNVFGSRWAFTDNLSSPILPEDTFMLDPGNFSQYAGTPYYFGMDPAWQVRQSRFLSPGLADLILYWFLRKHFQ
jgi:V-type H+-transporting ATPase subunit a